MVNVTSAAHAVVTAYAAAITLGGNYTYPLPVLADRVASFFLPNYTAFTLGAINISPNQSFVAHNFQLQYTDWRQNGPGTVVTVVQTQVQPVSNETALCWLTYRICPQNHMLPWDWTNVYGFRMTDNVFTNGLRGGWEFAIGDNEHLQYAKRFA